MAAALLETIQPLAGEALPAGRPTLCAGKLLRPGGHESSGMLGSMAQSGGFILLEAEAAREKTGAGEKVQVQVFGGLV